MSASTKVRSLTNIKNGASAASFVLTQRSDGTYSFTKPNGEKHIVTSLDAREA